ncbi:MAG: T9SS type A sorting domain-containing protein [Bacteroidetes bacterium]|nr:T9SS type A sorting domain-containing protein [Bacteroidota bacterium]
MSIRQAAYAQIVEPANSSYNVVALRVEFAPDTTRFTTGDGTFSGLDYGLDPKVDPLPHDGTHFEAHLDFLEHYVETASSGKTQVNTFLIPEIIQLQRDMASYSPIGEDSDSDSELSKLAELVTDAWSEGDRLSRFDPMDLPNDKTGFIVFHAGVGRDIELIGTTLEKTPQDLPSLFMSSKLLSRLGVEGLEFKGIQVDHSMIIPRTETRLGVNTITDEPFLLELSINGLLAASFLSFLGVPDLFNTETGESVIGPFGLMDPLGIFAYGGLFPPLPSAWTRSALGWASPSLITETGTFDIAVNEVARVDVSQAEYFLIENRVRTPENSGLELKISNHGMISTQNISGVSEDFNRFNVDAFQGGVVTEVNSYDFALPGWDADGNQYNGGILIWHIDERQLETTLNNDPARRAVDIEEADGAQDIGFDGNIGSPFDFYFEGNPSSVSLPSGRIITLYENRFGSDTYPNSLTNAGGNSFVTIENFSAPGTVMSFTVTRNQEASLTSLPAITLNSMMGVNGSVTRIGETIAIYSGSEVVIPEIGQLSSFIRPVFRDREITTLTSETNDLFKFNRYELNDRQLELVTSIELPSQLPPVGPVVYHQQANYILFSKDERSQIVRITANHSVNIYNFNEGSIGLASTDSDIYVVGRSQTGPLDDTPQWRYQLDSEVGFPVMGRDRTGLWGAIPQSKNLLLLLPDGSTINIASTTYVGEEVFSKAVAMADINEDGILDIVTSAGHHILAFSQGGALLPPFPIQMGAPVNHAPLVYDSDNGIGVIVGAADGNIYGFEIEQGGDPINGFPLSAGYAISATPLISSDTLTVVTQDAILRRYIMGNNLNVSWGEQYGGPTNLSFVSLTSEGVVSPTLLNFEETYNWPNPIRDGATFFRSMTSEPSDITVTVIDAAGSLVDSFNFSTSAGTSHEVQWQTDAVSGIYYARIQAVSTSGRKDSLVIKLAIIR